MSILKITRINQNEYTNSKKINDILDDYDVSNTIVVHGGCKKGLDATVDHIALVFHALSHVW